MDDYDSQSLLLISPLGPEQETLLDVADEGLPRQRLLRLRRLHPLLRAALSVNHRWDQAGKVCGAVSSISPQLEHRHRLVVSVWIIAESTRTASRRCKVMKGPMAAGDLSNHLLRGLYLHLGLVVVLLHLRVHRPCPVERLRQERTWEVSGDEEINDLPGSIPCFNNRQVPAQSVAEQVPRSVDAVQTDLLLR